MKKKRKKNKKRRKKKNKRKKKKEEKGKEQGKESRVREDKEKRSKGPKPTSCPLINKDQNPTPPISSQILVLKPPSPPDGYK